MGRFTEGEERQEGSCKEVFTRTRSNEGHDDMMMSRDATRRDEKDDEMCNRSGGAYLTCS